MKQFNFNTLSKTPSKFYCIGISKIPIQSERGPAKLGVSPLAPLDTKLSNGVRKTASPLP